ncbi:DUF6894 family protein [Methylobacterium nigriterrae]|uniref:DUF6894 family protein n=1 Tax=Methylobacterium nigriterrae TaxID=3127512 RepID=UPI003D66884B
MARGQRSAIPCAPAKWRNSVPRYFFDLHSDGLSEWDDEGTECRSGDEILHHALGMLRGLPDGDGLKHAPAVVTAHDGAGRVVVTATLKPSSEAHIRWSEEQVVPCGAAIVHLPGSSASAP